ncbi:hypothetical protein GF327_06935, partial [Candidatus Woesearchaeota archaeon]|nr:hypothetical protein [Candidatus Woesearchaeota archaeon]
MKAISVEPNKTQKLKDYLSKNNFLKKNYKFKKQEDKIIIPVKKISKKIKSKIKSKFPGSEFIKADFKKRDIKKTYKD